MRKSVNKGFILMESLMAFGLLTSCIFIFLSLQSSSLQQSAQLQERAEILRVLYEEVQNQQGTFPTTVSYTTQRNQTYQIRFWQTNQQQHVQIKKGAVLAVVSSEE